MNESFDTALERTAAALTAIAGGDPGPFAACWTETDDGTLMGGFLTRVQGAVAVRETLGWVASRFSNGDLVAEYDQVLVGNDWAMTAGYERGVLALDGAEPAPFAVRVTHVYRLEEGVWRIIHRHGDHVPA